MGLLVVTKPTDASGAKPDGAGVGSLSDLVMSFFEDDDNNNNTRWPKHPDLHGSSEDDDVDEVDEPGESAAERRAFWDTQLHNLKDLLSSTTTTESRLRRATESAVSSLRSSSSSSSACSCSVSPTHTTLPCRSCTLRLLSARLRRAGHDAAVCLSRWRATPSSPAGDHAYLDVVLAPAAQGKPTRRLIVEPAFRAEFEMARACPEYSALVGLLPEVFVGRADRMRGVLKLVCAAASKCLTDNGMHVAPWRKQRYMAAKWLSAPVERIVGGVDEAKLGTEEDKVAPESVSLFPPARKSSRLRASMLTYDLLLDGKLPATAALCTAVEVV